MVYIAHGPFSFFHFFHLAKEKTKIGITDHMTIFRFYVCELGTFSVFYHEIENRKTKGWYKMKGRHRHMR